MVCTFRRFSLPASVEETRGSTVTGEDSERGVGASFLEAVEVVAVLEESP